MPLKILVAGIVLVATGILSGCSKTGRLAPLTSFEAGVTRPGNRHTVRRGESVYAIAWRYGFDYSQLAAWNNLREPFTIYPGQTLRLTRPGGSRSRPAKGRAKTSSTRPKSRKSSPASSTASPPKGGVQVAGAKAKGPSTERASSSQASRPAASQQGSSTKAKGIDSAKMAAWAWPTKGKVSGQFSKGGGKGVDIVGRAGQPIRAAHGGLTVYSGSGLIGYGKLIIVKHNKRFLSAYAHNSAVHVKEGDLVARGQHIADMGSSGADRVKLHFEIRRDGKPVNPLKYLPR